MADKIIKFTNKHRKLWSAFLLTVFSCLIIVLATESAEQGESDEPSPNIQNGIKLEVKKSTEPIDVWHKEITYCRNEKFKLKTSLEKEPGNTFEYTFSAGHGKITSTQNPEDNVDLPENDASNEYQLNFTDEDFGDNNRITVTVTVTVDKAADGDKARTDTATIIVLKNDVALDAPRFICKGEAFQINILHCEDANPNDYTLFLHQAVDGGDVNLVKKGDWVWEVTGTKVSANLDDLQIDLISTQNQEVLDTQKVTVVGVEALVDKDCIKINGTVNLQANPIPAGAQFPKGKLPKWTVNANKGVFSKIPPEGEFITWTAPGSVNVCERFTFTAALCEATDSVETLVLEEGEYKIVTSQKYTCHEIVTTCIYYFDKSECEYKEYDSNLIDWRAFDVASGSEEDYEEDQNKYYYSPTDTYGTKSISANFTVNSSSGSSTTYDLSTEIVTINPEECKIELHHNVSSYQESGKQDWIQMKFYPPTSESGEIEVVSEVKSKDKNFRPYFKVYDDKHQLIIDRTRDKDGTDKADDDKVPGALRPKWRYDKDNPLPSKFYIEVVNASEARWDIQFIVTVTADSVHGSPPPAPEGGYLVTKDGFPYPIQTIMHNVTAFRTHDFEASTGVSPSESFSTPTRYMNVGTDIYFHNREAVVSHLNSAITGIKLPVAIGQTYRSVSQMSEYAGRGWTASWDKYFVIKDNGEIVYHRGDGRADIYTQTGVENKDELDSGYLNIPPGFAESAYLSVFRAERDNEKDPCGENDTYAIEITHKDNSKSKYIGKVGTFIKIESYTDRFNNKIDYKYDKYGDQETGLLPAEDDQKIRNTGALLKSIIDDSGKNYTISYNNTGNKSEIKEISDGREITFKYKILGKKLKDIEASSTKDDTYKIAYSYYDGGDLRSFMQLANLTGITHSRAVDLRSNIPNEVESVRYFAFLESKINRDGNTTTVTDKNKVTSKYTFAESNHSLVSNVIQDSGGLDLTTNFEYTSELYFDKITHPEGNIDKYAYDTVSNKIKNRNGNVTSLTKKLGTYSEVDGSSNADITVSTTYNDYSQVLTITRPNGTTITNKYTDDAFKKLISRKVPVQSGDNSEKYAEMSFIVQTDGRLKETTSITGLRTIKTYDGAKLTKIEVKGDDKTLTTEFREHDEYYRSQEVEGPNGGKINFEYYPFGQQKKVTYPSKNGTADENTRASKFSQYWDNGTLRSVTTKNPVAKVVSDQPKYSLVSSTIDFKWDSIGRPTTKTSQAFGKEVEITYSYLNGYLRLNKITDVKGIVEEYGYDTASRLNKTTKNNDEFINVFNKNGYSIEEILKVSGSAGLKTEFTVDFLGRVVKENNIKTGLACTKVYNDMAQLISVTKTASGNKVTDVEFKYDGSGKKYATVNNLKNVTVKETFDEENNIFEQRVNDILFNRRELTQLGHKKSNTDGYYHTAFEVNKTGAVVKASTGSSYTGAVSNLTNAPTHEYNSDNQLIKKTVTNFEHKSPFYLTEDRTELINEISPSHIGESGVAGDSNWERTVKELDPGTFQISKIIEDARSSQQRITTYSTDHKNRTQTSTKGSHVITKNFNKDDLLEKIERKTPALTEVESYTYDKYNRKETHTLKDGTVHTYHYYPHDGSLNAGYLKSLNIGGKVLTEYKNYNVFGHPELIIERDQNGYDVELERIYFKTGGGFGKLQRETTTFKKRTDAPAYLPEVVPHTVFYNFDALGRLQDVVLPKHKNFIQEVLTQNYEAADVHRARTVTRNGTIYLHKKYDTDFPLIHKKSFGQTTPTSPELMSEEYIYGNKYMKQLKSVHRDGLESIENINITTNEHGQPLELSENSRSKKAKIDVIGRVNEVLYTNTAGPARGEDVIPWTSQDDMEGEGRTGGFPVKYIQGQMGRLAGFVAPLNFSSVEHEVLQEINFRPQPLPAEQYNGSLIIDNGEEFDLIGWLTGDPLIPTANPSAVLAVGKDHTKIENSSINFRTGGQVFTWEMEIPNGSYNVTLIAGDVNSADNLSYKVMAEDILFLDSEVNSTENPNSIIEQSGLITVEDGRLTLRLDPSSTGSHICGIRISREVYDFAEFNFTSQAGTRVEANFHDFGLPYGTGNLQYGWVDSDNIPVDVSASAVQNTDSGVDPELNSFISLDSSLGNKWEIQLPNGTYLIQTQIADSEATSAESFHLKVEDYTVVYGWSKVYDSEAEVNENLLRSPWQQVKILDGKLTLSADSGKLKISTLSIKTIDNETTDVLNTAYAAAQAAGATDEEFLSTAKSVFSTSSNPFTVVEDIKDGVARIRINMDYDKNGNRRNNQFFNYFWDSKNRMTKASQRKKSGSESLYIYDGLGRRALQVVIYKAYRSTNPVVYKDTKKYIYDALSIVDEVTPDDKLLLRHYYDTAERPIMTLNMNFGKYQGLTFTYSYSDADTCNIYYKSDALSYKFKFLGQMLTQASGKRGFTYNFNTELKRRAKESCQFGFNGNYVDFYTGNTLVGDRILDGDTNQYLSESGINECRSLYANYEGAYGIRHVKNSSVELRLNFITRMSQREWDKKNYPILTNETFQYHSEVNAIHGTAMAEIGITTWLAAASYVNATSVLAKEGIKALGKQYLIGGGFGVGAGTSMRLITGGEVSLSTVIQDFGFGAASGTFFGMGITDEVLGSMGNIGKHYFAKIGKFATKINPKSYLRPGSAGRYASGSGTAWQKPGQRVINRADNLGKELNLKSIKELQGGQYISRELKAHELLALSERHGVEFSMNIFKSGRVKIFAGTADGVTALGGKNIVRSVHTHPGKTLLSGQASPEDIMSYLLGHRAEGGKGALEIIFREASGRARTVQYGPRKALEMFRETPMGIMLGL